MKILLAGLLILCVLGLFISTFSPLLYQRFYPKKSASGRLKILVFRPALILIFLLLIGVAFTGWQSVQYNETLPLDGEDLIDTTGYTQKQYPVYSSQYDLLKIVDGGSAQLDIRGHDTKVKLIGVRSFKSAGKKQTACFARHADGKLRSYLKNKKMELEGDDILADNNKGDSLMRYVIVNDENINIQMIKSGYAKAAHKNYKYRHEFLAAEKEAKDKGAGFWSGTICNTPVASSNNQAGKAINQPGGSFDGSAEGKHAGKGHGGSHHNSHGSSSQNSDGGCRNPTIFDSLLNAVLRRC